MRRDGDIAPYQRLCDLAGTRRTRLNALQVRRFAFRDIKPNSRIKPDAAHAADERLGVDPELQVLPAKRLILRERYDDHRLGFAMRRNLKEARLDRNPVEVRNRRIERLLGDSLAERRHHRCNNRVEGRRRIVAKCVIAAVRETERDGHPERHVLERHARDRRRHRGLFFFRRRLRRFIGRGRTPRQHRRREKRPS